MGDFFRESETVNLLVGDNVTARHQSRLLVPKREIEYGLGQAGCQVIERLDSCGVLPEGETNATQWTCG